MEHFQIIDSVLDEKKTYISLKWDNSTNTLCQN